MTTASNTRQIKELRQENGRLRTRINELVDELSTIQNELRRFKKDVADDIKYLTERTG
jgi:predicted RNase H-like nuclease (RuvC/YqgF family)